MPYTPIKCEKTLYAKDAKYKKFVDCGVDDNFVFDIDDKNWILHIKLKYSKVVDIVHSPDYIRFHNDESQRRGQYFRGEITPEMIAILLHSNKLYGKKSTIIMSELDQFYTKPNVANNCYEFLKSKIKISSTYLFLEPSAGDGSFFDLMPPKGRIGLDLEPKKFDDIRRGDFLDYKGEDLTRKTIVLGNPPFGKNASLAIKFFNHAASFPNVDVIAFIVPKTFRKVSLQNKISMEFGMVDETNLDDNSFLKNGNEYKVPSCFQIWRRLSSPRKTIKTKTENKWFSFVKKDETPDLAVRRVGGRTGICVDEIEPCKSHSFYFLKLKQGIGKIQLMEHINDLQKKKRFLVVASNTAGVRSMSKGEFVETLKQN